MTRVVAGDPDRKILMRAIKPMCGPRVRSFYLAQGTAPPVDPIAQGDVWRS
jgi:hypothetical protein